MSHHLLLFLEGIWLNKALCMLYTNGHTRLSCFCCGVGLVAHRGDGAEPRGGLTYAASSFHKCVISQV